MIALTLPFPVSVNAMYANAGKRRVKSNRYRTWRSDAGRDINKQKPKPIEGWYTMTVILHEKDRKRRDPDNFVKCISDILEHHGLIENDCLCSGFQVERVLSPKAKCEVIVRPSNGISDTREVA